MDPSGAYFNRNIPAKGALFLPRKKRKSVLGLAREFRIIFILYLQSLLRNIILIVICYRKFAQWGQHDRID